MRPYLLRIGLRSNVALLTASLLATNPASAVSDSTNCYDVAVLAASGYSGPKRSYKLRGNCRVRYWKADSDSGISEGVVLHFFAEGKAAWEWRVAGDAGRNGAVVS